GRESPWAQRDVGGALREASRAPRDTWRALRSAQRAPREALRALRCALCALRAGVLGPRAMAAGRLRMPEIAGITARGRAGRSPRAAAAGSGQGQGAAMGRQKSEVRSQGRVTLTPDP